MSESDEQSAVDGDPRATQAAAALRTDPVLEPVVERHGPLALTPASDPFERLVVSIIRQQISMDGAAAIRERLAESVDISPTGILTADRERLRKTGLSEAKIDYLTNTARTFRDKAYTHDSFASMRNADIVDELTAITGIGPWTAKMFLIFGLGRPDVFPVEDLGVRRGMERIFEAEMSRGEMCERATEWEPYRSYSALYLWEVYDG